MTDYDGSLAATGLEGTKPTNLVTYLPLMLRKESAGEMMTCDLRKWVTQGKKRWQETVRREDK